MLTAVVVIRSCRQQLASDDEGGQSARHYVDLVASVSQGLLEIAAEVVQNRLAAVYHHHRADDK